MHLPIMRLSTMRLPTMLPMVYILVLANSMTELEDKDLLVLVMQDQVLPDQVLPRVQGSWS